MSLNSLDINNRGELVLPKINFVGHFPSNNTIKLKTFDCFTHSFVKLSVTTHTAGTLTLKWLGSNNMPILTNQDHLDDPANPVFASSTENLRAAKDTSIITFPTEVVTLTANTYKMFVIPVQGERCSISIVSDGSDNEGICVKVALSNNFHYVMNS